ncbi:MAG: hypothetical protein HRT90_05975 [Candidatus Margulisbacteria bacterium]|nr:hypothetical protein [Candidatus Margulisiibacteriota bacterium]
MYKILATNSLNSLTEDAILESPQKKRKIEHPPSPSKENNCRNCIFDDPGNTHKALRPISPEVPSDLTNLILSFVNVAFYVRYDPKVKDLEKYFHRLTCSPLAMSKNNLYLCNIIPSIFSNLPTILGNDTDIDNVLKRIQSDLCHPLFQSYQEHCIKNIILWQAIGKEDLTLFKNNIQKFDLYFHTDIIFNDILDFLENRPNFQRKLSEIKHCMADNNQILSKEILDFGLEDGRISLKSWVRLAIITLDLVYGSQLYNKLHDLNPLIAPLVEKLINNENILEDDIILYMRKFPELFLDFDYRYPAELLISRLQNITIPPLRVKCLLRHLNILMTTQEADYIREEKQNTLCSIIQHSAKKNLHLSKTIIEDYKAKFDPKELYKSLCRAADNIDPNTLISDIQKDVNKDDYISLFCTAVTRLVEVNDFTNADLFLNKILDLLESESFDYLQGYAQYLFETISTYIQHLTQINYIKAKDKCCNSDAMVSKVFMHLKSRGSLNIKITLEDFLKANFLLGILQ